MLTVILTTIIVGFLVVWTILRKLKHLKNYNPSKTFITVPGLSCKDPIKGNLAEIAKAASFPEFLQELHSQFGPIASFWYGPTLTISLASANQFKKTLPIFDRHPEMFLPAAPLISMRSIQFQNGSHGKDLYKRLSQPFSHSPTLELAPGMTKLAKQMCEAWVDGSPIEIHQQMMSLAICIITRLQFGETFRSEDLMGRFQQLYTCIIGEIDNVMDAQKSLAEVEKEEKFNNSLEEFKEIIRKVVLDHKAKKESGDYARAPFLDSLLEYTNDMDELISQSITFFLGGFHTTGNALTWVFYNLCIHPEVQKKVREEVGRVVGDRGVQEQQDVDGLVFTAQVINETLRLFPPGSFSTRIANKNLVIDGHSIPEGTHLLNALCVSLMDPKIFPEPQTFNPDRFSPGNLSPQSLAFSPFGFGVRKCPGYKFAHMEVLTAVAVVVQRFRITMVDGGKRVQPKFGFVTKPQQEIWGNVCKI